MAADGIHMQDDINVDNVPQGPVSQPPPPPQQQNNDVNKPNVPTPSESSFFGSAISAIRSLRRCPSSNSIGDGGDEEVDDNVGVAKVKDNVSDVSTNLFPVSNSSPLAQQNLPNPTLEDNDASPVPLSILPTHPLPQVFGHKKLLLQLLLLSLVTIRVFVIIRPLLDINNGNPEPKPEGPLDDHVSEAICEVDTIYETLARTCLVPSLDGKGKEGGEEECSCHKKMMKVAQTDFKLRKYDDHLKYKTSL